MKIQRRNNYHKMCFSPHKKKVHLRKFIMKKLMIFKFYKAKSLLKNKK